MEEGSRGDGGADIFVGVHDELGVVEVGVLVFGEVGCEGLEVELGDVHFVCEEAFAVG